MSVVISVRNLSKTYVMGEQSVHALQSVSLDISRGEFVCVVGPSGSGKSTLMHILGCLDRPDSGTYLLDGQDVSRLGDDEISRVRNKKIGFVFQGFNLLSRTSALENVELPLLYDTETTLTAAERKRSAMEALHTVGLQGRERHHPNQLSGGQQQRVAIARALMTRPSILLADEPTGNLDSQTSVEVMELFQRLNREQNLTIVLITHEHDVAAYGSRIIVFKDGRVTSDETNGKRKEAAGRRDSAPVEGSV
jgi:putative ABC transport system ATP-binding protein